VPNTDDLLRLLDCPACRKDLGLVPQATGGQDYLACPACEFWYPVRQEIPVLLPPERVEGGLRRALGPAAPFDLPIRAPRAVDLKAITYSYYMRWRELIEFSGLESEPAVVDVGCSTGSLGAFLRPESIYVGLDLSFASVAFGRQNTGRWFCQADAQCLPLRRRCVSFVLSRELLEHVPDPRLAARELARAAPRGVIAVPTLEFPFFYDPINYLLLRTSGKHVRFGAFGYDHNELFDIATWRGMLEQAGFEVQRQAPIGQGACLNAFDVVYHSIWSWREFENLPRNGLPLPVARALFPLFRAFHRVDRKFLRKGTSEAFFVRASVAEPA
jgi:uncharacterized protein YbaR (Trm112 family)/ubiquinone/menaquinone biosynthesis C-methylase UbiE